MMSDEQKRIREQGGTAFPTSVSADSGGGLNHGAPGMTLRDYFAAKAMQGLLADSADRPDEDESIDDFIEDTATSAYMYADAMLAARSRKS